MPGRVGASGATGEARLVLRSGRPDSKAGTLTRPRESQAETETERSPLFGFVALLVASCVWGVCILTPPGLWEHRSWKTRGLIFHLPC